MLALFFIYLVLSAQFESFTSAFDIFFKDKESYEKVKQSGVITAEKVAETYSIPLEAVYGIYFVDNINALKLSICKYGPNGYMASATQKTRTAKARSNTSCS